MSKEVIIEVKNLHKSFKLPTEASSEIKRKVVNLFKGIKGYKKQKVLRGISFTVERGDFIGIVGRNGSGKSTLLKILAGIYEPNSGSVKVNGSFVPFIELGVGFNTELTGRENVYMNGALMGFSNDEIDAMYDEIVDFAELHEFMDQKLKNYSSGMHVRLAFSIAIQAKSDILILDEVLAVGDEAFQRKCNAYFAELRKYKKTVVLVTHNMEAVQQFCTKAVLIKGGEIVYSGDPAKVAQEYRELNMEVNTKNGKPKKIYDNDNVDVESKLTKTDKKLIFDIKATPRKNLPEAVLTFTINRDNGEILYRWVTDEKIGKDLKFEKNKTIKIHLEVDNIFPNGVFEVQIAVKKIDRSMEYAIFNSINTFEIMTKVGNNNKYWKPNENYELLRGDDES